MALKPNTEDVPLDPDDPRRFTMQIDGEELLHDNTLADMYPGEQFVDEEVDRLFLNEDCYVGGGAAPLVYIRRTA